MESQTENTEPKTNANAGETKASESVGPLKLEGMIAFKLGMTSVYDQTGAYTPVTVLKVEPLTVTQIKTEEVDGYQALQVACKPQKAGRVSKALATHLKKAGFENGAAVIAELRQKPPAGAAVGQKVSLDSFAIGDVVKVTGTSKGRGFSGVVKRHRFAGGPASHGSGFHRRPGSVGNRTEPGRVMPGRKLPGRYGADTVTVKGLQVINVDSETGTIMVKGGVPGARNQMVRVEKIG